MSESELNENTILKRRNSALEKENEDLKNEIKRLKKEKQTTDIIKCMEEIQGDLRPRYVRLDELIHNSGLEHIARQIFKYLDPKSVGQCRVVSTGWKSFIDNDTYWWIQVLEALKVKKMIRCGCGGFTHLQGWVEFQDTVAFMKENESLENLRLLGRFILDYYCCFGKRRIVQPSEPNKFYDTCEPEETPLHFAADKNRLDILNYLASLPTMCHMNLENVIKDNNWEYPSPQTILGNACQKNQVEIVEFFMNLRGNKKMKKIDFNDQTRSSYTLFHAACRSGNIEIVKLFLKHADELNIDLNPLQVGFSGTPRRGTTPFRLAISKSKVEVVKLLLSDSRLVVNDVNPIDKSPLFQSLSVVNENSVRGISHKEQDEIFAALVNSPRIPLEAITKYGKNIFHPVFDMKDAEKAEILVKEAVRRNIASHLSVAKISYSGFTAIHCAFNYGLGYW